MAEYILDWLSSPFFQFTDEEVERCYEEFYEDVHTEFLKYGEIVNFKVSWIWYPVLYMVYVAFSFVLFCIILFFLSFENCKKTSN